jgi:hypothetical protein
VVWINSQNNKWEQQSGQHYKEERNAIDADVSRNAATVNQLVLRDKLESGITGLELGQ